MLVPRGHIAQGFTDQTCPLNFSLNKLQTRLYMPGESTQWKAVRHSPLPARVLLPAAAQDKAKDPHVGSLSSKRHPSSSSYDPLSELPQTTGSRATRVPFLSLSEHPGSCGEQFTACNIRLQMYWLFIHAWKKLGCKPLKCLQK